MDGTAAEVAQLGDFEHDLGAAFFDGRQGIGCEPIRLSVLDLLGHARVGRKPGIPVTRMPRTQSGGAS